MPADLAEGGRGGGRGRRRGECGGARASRVRGGRSPLSSLGAAASSRCPAGRRLEGAGAPQSVGMAFVHLHTHSEYSLLDGANRIPDLVAHVKKLGMDSLAVTDHGNMHAAWSFYEDAKAPEDPADPRLRGLPRVRAAPGAREAAQRARRLQPPRPARQESRRLQEPRPADLDRVTPRGSTGGRESTRSAWSSTARGSSAWRRASRARWRCTSGRAATRRPSAAPSGSRGCSDRTASGSRSSSHGIAEERLVTEGMLRLGQELGIGVVATNDAHYLRREDAESHDVLLAIGTGQRPRRPEALPLHRRGIVRQVREGDAGALSGPSRRCWPTPRPWPTSASSTSRRSTSCPASPAPPGTPPTRRCSRTSPARARRGATARRCPPAVEERLDYELGVITTDRLRRLLPHRPGLHRGGARARHPGGPGPRLGGGLDRRVRARHHRRLPAQVRPAVRALPESRARVDARHRRRLLLRAAGRGDRVRARRSTAGRVVGQIVTFGTMKSRAAIKDVGRALGFTPARDRRARQADPEPAELLAHRSKEAVDELRDVVKLYATDERYRQLLDYAIALEGSVAPHGVHAAGVVIAPGPLDDTCRSARAPTRGAGAAADGEESIITQYDMNALEKAGMLKMDFLGLTTLTVIHDAVLMIAARTGVRPRPGRAAARRPQGLRAAARRAHGRRVPVRVAARHRHAARHALRPVRRPRRLERADAPRPARRRACTRVYHPAEARRGAGHLPASRRCRRCSSRPTASSPIRSR